jgi:hypothetical protein
VIEGNGLPPRSDAGLRKRRSHPSQLAQRSKPCIR